MSPRVAGCRLDLVVGAPHDRPRGSARARSLLRDSFVAIVRRGHPLARSKATLARYAALEHVVVARDEGDRGARWLRGLIERVASSLAAPS